MSGDVPHHYSVNNTPKHQKIQLSKGFVLPDTPRYGGFFRSPIYFLGHAGHIQAYLHRMQPGLQPGIQVKKCCKTNTIWLLSWIHSYEFIKARMNACTSKNRIILYAFENNLFCNANMIYLCKQCDYRLLICTTMK